MDEKNVMRSNRNCPVCGCNTVNHLFPLNMYLEDFGFPDQYHVARCDYCGMCFADTSACENDFEFYYSNNNFYGGMPSVTTENERPCFSVLGDILEKISGKDEQIIDVGMGDGGFLRYLSQLGYKKLYGMDPSSESINSLHNTGFNGICASVLGDIPEDYCGKFDVVSLMTVIEHLYHPGKAVNNIKKLLNNGGYAIITFPNCEKLEKCFQPLPCIVNHEHINYFSRKSIAYLMELNGFEEVEYADIKIDWNDGNITYDGVGVYKYSALENLYTGYNRDCETAISLKNYYANVSKIFEPQKETITHLTQSDKPVALWGVGSYLRYLWKETSISECNIQLLVDGSSRKQGEKFHGITIQSPEKLKDFDGILILTAMASSLAIKKIIDETGFSGKTIFLSEI